MTGLTPRSLQRLETCDQRLFKIVKAVAETSPLLVICGHRSVAEQQALFAQGRTMPGNIVTRIDGVLKKSNHNYLPSRAVDLAPLPLDWNNIPAFERLGATIKAEAAKQGVKIEWGGDWPRLRDYPHFELAE